MKRVPLYLQWISLFFTPGDLFCDSVLPTCWMLNTQHWTEHIFKSLSWLKSPPPASSLVTKTKQPTYQPSQVCQVVQYLQQMRQLELYSLTSVLPQSYQQYKTTKTVAQRQWVSLPLHHHSPLSTLHSSLLVSQSVSQSDSNRAPRYHSTTSYNHTVNWVISTWWLTVYTSVTSLSPLDNIL